jgi:hypothetical protein
MDEFDVKKIEKLEKYPHFFDKLAQMHGDRELHIAFITKGIGIDPMNLEFIKNQTQEICLMAVNTNGLSLQYVKEQTIAVVKAALSNDHSAIKYAKVSIILKILTELSIDIELWHSLFETIEAGNYALVPMLYNE